MIHLLIVAVGLLTVSLSGAVSPRGGIVPPGPEPRLFRVSELRTARSVATATAISRDRVLVAGGMAEGGGALRSFEVFDANSNHDVITGEMADARAGHSATRLQDGRVLILGGYNGTYLRTAEIFDPVRGRFIPTGAMHEGRSGHTATLLRDGAVLVTGGVGDGWSFLPTAELYDPRTGSFTQVGSMSAPRESHTATLLPNGKVLITGGHRGRRENIEIYASTEIYEPELRAFRQGPALRVARHKHEAVALADGRVLILGGSSARNEIKYTSTEMYDPRTHQITAGPPMRIGRYKFRDTAVRLRDGRVLVAGSGRFAELFDPAAGRFQPVAGDFGQSYAFAASAQLENDDVLIIGGYDDAMRNTAGVWRFPPPSR